MGVGVLHNIHLTETSLKTFEINMNLIIPFFKLTKFFLFFFVLFFFMAVLKL